MTHITHVAHPRNWRARNYKNHREKTGTRPPPPPPRKHEKYHQKMHIEEIDKPETMRIITKNPYASTAATPKVQELPGIMFHNQTTRQETGYRTFFDWGRRAWHLRLGLGILHTPVWNLADDTLWDCELWFTVRMQRQQNDDALCIVVLGGVDGESHNLKRHMYW